MEFEDLTGYSLIHLKTENILREKRVTMNLTQKEVAERAKITVQSYQRFESGERNIKTASFQLACRVIEALGMDISDFYHGKYTIGEKVYAENGELRYQKTGRLIEEDVTEESDEK